MRATQAQFGPIEIAPRFWIVPSWCEAPDPGALNLRLDPGLAFGTGSHPTTRLCLEWLREALAGGESRARLRLRLRHPGDRGGEARRGAVVGIDVDPQALAREPRQRAGQRRRRARSSLPDALRAGPPFDVVVANILANPLMLLAPALAARVAAGGRIALSGILAAQARRGRRRVCALVYTRAVAGATTAGSLLAGARAERSRPNRRVR